MGLLSKTSAFEPETPVLPKAEETKLNEKSKSVGLLRKSESLLESESLTNKKQDLDFFSFIQKYQLFSCAIFSKLDDYIRIENSIGFDGKSIITSLSSTSFWDGVIPERNTIYSFSRDDNTIAPFYQFLSSSLKDSINNIVIVKNSNILLFACGINEIEITDKEQFIIDFNSIDTVIHLAKQDFDSSFFSIYYKASIENFIDNQNILSTEYSFIFKSLANSIYNLLCSNLGKENVLLKEDCFQIKIDENMLIPFNLLEKHISTNLSQILFESTLYLSFSS